MDTAQADVRAWMTCICGKRGTRPKREEKEGNRKIRDPSVVLAYAICYRLDDALTRVQNPIFVLARIIPRREPLHSHARTEMSVPVVSESGSGKTHDHNIKRNEDATLSPVRLGICRNIVHEEASPDEKHDFEQILAVKVRFPVLNEATTLFFTEEHGHRLLHPPTK